MQIYTIRDNKNIIPSLQIAEKEIEETSIKISNQDRLFDLSVIKKNIKELSIENCVNLKSLTGLERCKHTLERLTVINCGYLENLFVFK